MAKAIAEPAWMATVRKVKAILLVLYWVPAMMVLVLAAVRVIANSP